MRTFAVHHKSIVVVIIVVTLVATLYQVSPKLFNSEGQTLKPKRSDQLDEIQFDNKKTVLEQDSTTRQSSSKTNIVFILADDMGAWAAGTYGNPEIHTPNIDKLAREGLKFTNAFSNTPVCSASRASILTGIDVLGS